MIQYKSVLLFIIINVVVRSASENGSYSFPDNFLFGVSTSAYQVEGAWNEEGKGENNWDRLTHDHPELIADGNNADVTANTYFKTKEDVQLLADLGVHFYRFSISWSRILPIGFPHKINEEGIQYYNNLINELLKHNITPMVTLYHWDLPQSLQTLGGWTNLKIADYFVDYAKVAFDNFGDRVKYWITINEPKQFCLYDYGENINLSGIGNYLCAHTVILAHAKVYHLYQNNYKAKYNGKISMALNLRWKEPLSQSQEDLDASERMIQFILGIYANPIYHKNGDYPKIVKDQVATHDSILRFNHSRLPTFTPEEIEYIQGTYDFFGLNMYTARLVTSNNNNTYDVPSFWHDTNVQYKIDDKWRSSYAAWLKIAPWGLRKMLNWIKNQYDDPEIFILENGYAGSGEIKDYNRIQYHKEHLQEVLKAMHEDKVNVIGYTIWSFIDAFEWRNGYNHKFGLYHVNFTDPSRPRTMKNSARMYKRLIKTKKINWNDNGEN